jgi:hypothetical protein
LILRNALLEACVQNLVKVTIDTDVRVPSIANIMSSLASGSIRSSLEAAYCVPPIPVRVGSNEPMPREIEDRLLARETASLRRQFADAWTDLSERWQRIEADGRLGAFKTWRDKVIAHSELQHKAGTYAPLDLAELGLKWGDLEALVTEIEQLVSGVGIVVRGAAFAWQDLDAQLLKASTEFWSLIGARTV